MRAARTRRAFRLLHYPVTFVVPLYNALQIKLSICLWHESQSAKTPFAGRGRTQINERFIFHNAPRCLNSVSAIECFYCFYFPTYT